MINHQAHGQQFYPKLFSINRHNRVEYDEIFKTIENIITGQSARLGNYPVAVSFENGNITNAEKYECKIAF